MYKAEWLQCVMKCPQLFIIFSQASIGLYLMLIAFEKKSILFDNVYMYSSFLYNKILCFSFTLKAFCLDSSMGLSLCRRYNNVYLPTDNMVPLEISFMDNIA